MLWPGSSKMMQSKKGEEKKKRAGEQQWEKQCDETPPVTQWREAQRLVAPQLTSPRALYPMRANAEDLQGGQDKFGRYQRGTCVILVQNRQNVERLPLARPSSLRE